MTKVKAWPSRAAHIVDSGVAAVEVIGAKEALKTARKLKGDEDAVRAVAEKWRQAAEKIRDARNHIFQSWNDLTTDWEGGASVAFQNTTTNNAQLALDNATNLLAAEGTLLDLALHVTNAYNTAIELTTYAASRIEPALGGIGLISNRKADKPVITQALQDYVEGISKAQISLRSAVSSEKDGFSRMALEVTKLRAPTEYPERATNPRRWIYR